MIKRPETVIYFIKLNDLNSMGFYMILQSIDGPTKKNVQFCHIDQFFEVESQRNWNPGFFITFLAKFHME